MRRSHLQTQQHADRFAQLQICFADQCDTKGHLDHRGCFSAHLACTLPEPLLHHMHHLSLCKPPQLSPAHTLDFKDVVPQQKLRWIKQASKDGWALQASCMCQLSIRGLLRPQPNPALACITKLSLKETYCVLRQLQP